MKLGIFILCSLVIGMLLGGKIVSLYYMEHLEKICSKVDNLISENNGLKKYVKDLEETVKKLREAYRHL